MDLSQRVELRQELFLTTELRQGISILQMSAVELGEYVKQSVEENPFLDDDDWDWPLHPFSSGDYEKTVSADALAAESISCSQVAGEGQTHQSECREDAGAGVIGAVDVAGPSCERRVGRSFEDYLVEEETLASHLSAQLAFQATTPAQMAIGEFIIGSLDDSGYLHASVEAIANALGVPTDEVEHMLHVIQRFDPIGVAARSLAECLRVQLETKGQITPAIEKLLENDLAEFEKMGPAQVAREKGLSLAEVDAALEAMRQCTPRPGASFGVTSDPIWPEIVVEPVDGGGNAGSGADVFADLSAGSGYVVRLQDFFLPHLQINSYYKTLVSESAPKSKAPANDLTFKSKSAAGVTRADHGELATSSKRGELFDRGVRSEGNARSSQDADAYLRDKLKEAETLISSIAYRRATLYKVACCVVELQSAFFDEGFSHMRPLTMDYVAQLTGLSISTVSRVANGNYMQTPRGLFELRFFFQPAAVSLCGREVSQASVKHRIIQLIEAEDGRHPLSDQALADMLADDGAAVSRRTVNKYRTEMGIPSQSFRRRA